MNHISGSGGPSMVKEVCCLLTTLVFPVATSCLLTQSIPISVLEALCLCAWCDLESQGHHRGSRAKEASLRRLCLKLLYNFLLAGVSAITRTIVSLPKAHGNWPCNQTSVRYWSKWPQRRS